MNARVTHSVSVYCALPSVKHLRVVVLFGLDASLVLQFCQLGRSFLIHDLLQLTAHSAVSLTHLAKHVRLVHFLSDARLDHLLLVGTILALDLSLHVLALVLLHPFVLIFLFLFEFDVLFSVLVDIFKQVDASLVFAIPQLFSVFPLLGVLFCNELVNHALICLFISLNLGGVLLKLDCLSTMYHLFLVFDLLYLLLPLDCGL
jgi:hypothetical protein